MGGKEVKLNNCEHYFWIFFWILVAIFFAVMGGKALEKNDYVLGVILLIFCAVAITAILELVNNKEVFSFWVKPVANFFIYIIHSIIMGVVEFLASCKCSVMGKSNNTTTTGTDKTPRPPQNNMLPKNAGRVDRF